MEAKVNNMTLPTYKQKANNKDDCTLLKNELSILLKDRDTPVRTNFFSPVLTKEGRQMSETKINLPRRRNTEGNHSHQGRFEEIILCKGCQKLQDQMGCSLHF